ARAERLAVGGIDLERALDERERAVAIAQARVVDLGRAQQEAPLERRVLRLLRLGHERAGELLVIARALRVAREREDGGATTGLDGEDLVDLLDRARRLAELVLPEADELFEQADLARAIDRGLRRLRVQLEARAHAAAVGLRLARRRREERRERLEDR